ncbi:MAG: SDR family oxidoreductase [Acidobacteriota bacterium]|nr:SDR family oxidoreductase [Acidobacteriota bacterium]
MPKGKSKFHGKTGLITGASSGLGKRLALDLAAQGMNLGLGSRSEHSLQETAAGVRRAGAGCLVVPTDVTDARQCREMVSKVTGEFGALDYLILSAGLSMWTLFDQVRNVEIYRTLMEVNYLGAVHCIHPALPALKKQHGMIVAISSVQGRVGVPFHSGYTASKHALDGLLETLRTELHGQVRILNVMPGWIRSTRLRAHALSADGSPLGSASHRSRRERGVSVRECSRRITGALPGPGGNLYIPKAMGFLPLVKLLFPSLLRAGVRRAVRKQTKG